MEQKYIQEFDEWIKEIKEEISTLKKEISCLYSITGRQNRNIDHNYELIRDIQETREEFKQEITALKIVQVHTLELLKKKYKDDIVFIRIVIAELERLCHAELKS